MSLLRPGVKPEFSRVAPVRPLLIALTALALAGCRGHTEAYNSDPQTVVATPPPAAVTKAELEDDGLPTQLPPARTHQIKDDPSEPWSRNYGSHGGAPSEDAADGTEAEAEAESPRVIPAAPKIPGDLPPTFRRQLAAATPRG